MDDGGVNDIVISGIDQFLPIEKAQKDLSERIDHIIANAIEDGDPDVAFKTMKALLDLSQISGIGFAKFVYTLKYNWSKFKTRDSFEDRAQELLGRGKKSIDDNFRVWEMLVSSDIPREYRDKFMTMPIRVLIPIANMWKQGWEVETHQWLRLSNAPDPSTVGKIIREIKGKTPKEGSLQMEWKSSSKEIIVWVSGKPHSIYLTYDETDPEIQKALLRLMSGKVMESA
jgi:hypothetical protein